MDKQVATTVTRLLTGWPSMRALQPDALKATMGEYLAALEGLSLQDVEAACQLVRTGRVGNPEFPPSPALLASTARKAKDDAAHEAWKLRERIAREPDVILPPDKEKAREIWEKTRYAVRRCRPINEQLKPGESWNGEFIVSASGAYRRPEGYEDSPL